MDTEFSFVLDQFCRKYQLSDRPEIGYGLQEDSSVRISDEGRAFLSNREMPSLEDVRWYNFGDCSLPILFHDGSDTLFTQRGSNVDIHFDLFAESFFWLSGWQEIINHKRDQYGRFPWKESLQYRWDITEIPVVNYFFRLLAEQLQISPSRKTFTLALTHDIDAIYGWKEDALNCLKHLHLNGVCRNVKSAITREPTWQNLEELADAAAIYQAQASFYFLAGQGSIEGIPHADYDIQSPYMQQLAARLEQRGCETGIHPSAGTHEEAALLKKDLSTLDRKITGGRFHFLKFDMAKTPSVLEEAGLQYDSTLGFAEHIGFRNGNADPFYLFDHHNQRPTPVAELPLAIMDTTFRNPDYMGISPAEIPESASRVIDEFQKFGGTGAVLWHNYMFSNFKYHSWKEAYNNLLKLLHQKGAQMTSADRALQEYR